MGQRRTGGNLLESLRITLAATIEMNRRQALQSAGEGYEETRITV